MLIRTTCKVWEGLGKDVRIIDSTNGDTFLVNANRVNGIKVRASTKSSFMFSDAPLGNSRVKADYIESEDSVANLVTRADYTFQSLFVTLPIFPDNDDSETAVSTRINCESIAYVYKDPENEAGQCYVVYYEASKRREVLVDNSINEVFSLADVGNHITTPA